MSLEFPPWKLRMSGRRRLPVGSDGTAKRYWRCVPSISIVVVVTPVEADDSQPDARSAGADWAALTLAAVTHAPTNAAATSTRTPTLMLRYRRIVAFRSPCVEPKDALKSYPGG